MLSADEGNFLLKIAREAIKTYIKDKKVIEVPEDTPKTLKENMGVFVTLNKNKMLRGCIGYPEPIKPAVNAVIEVAISSATGDPRFPPMNLDEVENVEIDVSVLTRPEIVEVEMPKDYLNKIKVGEDGLIIEKGLYKGLLLPQVAVEWNWDVEAFLCNTCMKAGLTPDCWYEDDIRVYRFKAQIFQE